MTRRGFFALVLLPFARPGIPVIAPTAFVGGKVEVFTGKVPCMSMDVVSAYPSPTLAGSPSRAWPEVMYRRST
jgi:hypothetical protein